MNTLKIENTLLKMVNQPVIVIVSLHGMISITYSGQLTFMKIIDDFGRDVIRHSVKSSESNILYFNTTDIKSVDINYPFTEITLFSPQELKEIIDAEMQFWNNQPSE
jgi:hypothetical protein